MKRIVLIFIAAAGLLLAGCETLQFAQRSVCLECLTEAQTRGAVIAPIVLMSKKATVAKDGETVVFSSPTKEAYKISCTAGEPCSLTWQKVKADGTVAGAGKAGSMELNKIYCPKVVKKYGLDKKAAAKK